MRGDFMLSTSKDASVIVKSQFVVASSKTFKEYIEYVDRDDAKRKTSEHESKMDYMNYQDYMDDDEKTTSLFTKDEDKLNKKQKEELKKSFSIAQKNNSILWQDVISFDNKWLEEHGVYDSSTHTIDEKNLKNVARLSMNEMLKKEGLDKSAIWSGAIHYNTDNIHIHLATVEPSPTRERGKRKLKSLETMKSKVINKIMDRSHEQKSINNLIRENMVNSKKKDSTFTFKNRAFKKEFLTIYNSLPEDRRQWSYGYNSLSNVKPLLDKMSKDYIEKHHKKDFQELLSKLDKEVEIYKKTYGISDKKRYEDYKKNKIDELYKRMGNAFLNEMKNYDKSQKESNRKLLNGSNQNNVINNKRDNLKNNISLNQIKYGIDRMLNSEYKNWKNQLAYEKLQQDIEMER
ncbi:MAG: MobP2 family relaxase [Bacillota bacterium]